MPNPLQRNLLTKIPKYPPPVVASYTSKPSTYILLV